MTTVRVAAVPQSRRRDASARPTGRVEFINPEGLDQNPAFTNVVVVSGPVRTICVGGQDAVTAEGEVVGKGDIAAQTEHVLEICRQPWRRPARAPST